MNHLDPTYLFLGIPVRSKEEEGAVNLAFFLQVPNGRAKEPLVGPLRAGRLSSVEHDPRFRREFKSGSLFRLAPWSKDGGIHAIGDDPCFRYCGGQQGIPRSIHHPPAWRGKVESCAGEDVLLQSEILRGSISPDGGIDGEIRALATSNLPSIAIEGMSAVTRERPLVVESQNNWSEVTELR